MWGRHSGLPGRLESLPHTCPNSLLPLQGNDGLRLGRETLAYRPQFLGRLEFDRDAREIETDGLRDPAAADFRLCNNTSSRVGISVGYKENDGWTTEGWWNLPAKKCETLLPGTLVARFYYIYAIDYDHGGEWSGQAFMCTRDKEFTIHGTGDCLARGWTS